MDDVGWLASAAVTRKVVHYLDTSVFGGMEQVILTLIESVDRSRFEPILAHHADPDQRPLVTGALELGAGSWVLPRMTRATGLRHLPDVVRTLRREKVDLFHAHLNWPLACHHGVLAATTARVPVVASEHAFVPIPWRASILIERTIARFVDRYVAVSNAVARKLVETFAVRSHKVHVVYNGVPLERFRVPPDEGLRRELTRGRDHLLLSIGRLDYQKGHEYLLRAAADVPTASVVIVGEGPARSSLEREASALGLKERVQILARRDDIPELLAVCDVFVQPSAEFEGLGLAAIEAMAAGKPVVATAVGGPAEVVNDGVSGFVVPPRQPQALAVAIRTIFADPELASRLASAARRRCVELFSATQMAARMSTIYDDVLDRRRGRAGIG